MFSNNTQGFIILNIYVALIVDIIILINIYYQIIKTKIIQRRYMKTMNKLEPLICNNLKQHVKLRELKDRTNKDYKKMIAIDIINNYSENSDKENGIIIQTLELDTFLINKIKRKPSIKYFKRLAFMKVPSAYEVLLKYLNSEDIDIKYTCYFGLLMLDIDTEKKDYVIHELVNSGILSDRIIEILDKVELKFDEWMRLLETEKSETGKIIFLNILTGKEELKNDKNSDKLLKFLGDSKEVKIAAIRAICSSKNEKYVDAFYTMFRFEKQWEIRVAIAEGMTNFAPELTKYKLLYMVKDEQWWVRFSATKAISLMGKEGVYTLVELSMDKSDEEISALANYFRNSNKKIYGSVENIEGV